MTAKPSVVLTISGDADKLSKATTQATQSVTDMSDKMDKESDKIGSAHEKSSGRISNAMGLASAAIAGVAVVGVGQLMDLSKSMEALDVKAKTVFQDSLPDIEAWAEQNRKAFGDSTRNVVAMAANLADLLKPMGFTSQQAADMSKKILDLSGALSRWSGGTKSAAEVSEILADAMLGETDGLKSLGISISAAEVEAKALSMGLGKTTVDMLAVKAATFSVTDAQHALSDAIAKHGKNSDEAHRKSLALEQAQQKLTTTMAGGKTEIDQQATALATQQLILEKSTDAQTAWADGGRAAAEAQNGLSSTMQESAEKLATVVAPAFAFLVEMLTKVADWMNENQTATLIVVGLAAAVWLLNAAMAANPIALLVLAIGILVGGLIVLWTKSAGFRDFFIDMWHWIQNAAGNTVNWIVGAWNGVIDFFSQIPKRVGEALGSMGRIIADSFKFAVNMGIDALNWGIRRMNDLIYGINVINPFENIPYIPQIQRLHTGGTVGGAPGTERMILARAGEHVSAPGQGGGNELRVRGTGALAELIQAMIYNGDIQLDGR